MMNNTEKAKALHEENKLRVRALAAQGLSIDDSSLAALDTKIKLESIYEAVVPEERRTKDKLKFEEVVSSQLDSIDQQLEQMEAQQRVGQLLQGVPGVNPQINGFPK